MPAASGVGSQVLGHTFMFGLSTCGNCGDRVTFVVGQTEFLEVISGVTKHSLWNKYFDDVLTVDRFWGAKSFMRCR
jgi:hypothetical protein